MDFIDEMNAVVALQCDEFHDYIKKKLSKEKDYLDRLFWLPDGSQMTVFNYLIAQHQEGQDSATHLTDKIDVILDLSENVNIGEPLHQAIAAGKIQLALHLLCIDNTNRPLSECSSVNIINALSVWREQIKELASQSKAYIFDVNKRDNEGRTLLSLAIDSKNTELLISILARNPNIHTITNKSKGNAAFQPLHQAVVLDYVDGIRLLAHEGANLANPIGIMKDTPVLLAARLLKMNALEVLMEFSVDDLNLNAENNHYFEDKKTGHTAIEELCLHIANNKTRVEAIRGVAILLCHGAEPPRNEVMRALLRTHRVDLLKAVHCYLEDKPDLVDPFVKRCHLSESALHCIVYADHSWGNALRHLFGSPCSAAFLVEDLVIRKYSNTLVNQGTHEPLHIAINQQLPSEQDSVKLYAEFVRRYQHAYDNQLLPNCWSTMRWKIAKGDSDWGTVERYATTYPKSRTGIIYKEMFTKPYVSDLIGNALEANL
ncbi:Dot/Icm T4SS effector AnkC/LegA12 [Legionella worsleiensis]|uniref:Ankyrin repeat-containing protein n=2 Tax=Legionella worsleiensis TaxID=45076 RepID=A0A0W1AFM4_9GAMM|nr:ankyrin repeat-containing protein [Legionella worsleiensis]STY31829.1 ankyrin repeat-containing protein [Legionella worsleiensis]